ncbi:cytochrome P450 [Dietzia sp. B32]|uniref:cytochrome P450 n=1 Tax=Dietzia sp. B32 TaxID=2915130 RepID=UPI0021AE2002|nr:cytochrome P450 [Dietzia sp. B32]UVE95917.1 cytochrome P450 [Dietzia sp. B32]
MTTSYEYEKFFGLDAEQLKCPHTAFDEVRSECPVSRSDALGFWVVADHENAQKVFKDASVFSTKKMLGEQVSDEWQRMVEMAAKRPGAKKELGDDYGSSDRKVLLFADPPEHGRHRRLIMGALTPNALKSWAPRIEETADIFVDGVDAGEEVEFVDDFANKYTMTVIADILGFPRDMVPQMLDWTEGFNSMVGNPDQTDEQIEALVDTRYGFDAYCNKQIDDREVNPTEDLISRIVKLNTASESPLNRDDLFQVLQLTMVGGSETSATALSKMVEYLGRHPEMWAELKADTERIPQFMEEMLRMFSPVQGSFRAVTEDIELGGQQLRAGDMLWVGMGTSNRDPKVFEDPDRMDIDRKQLAASHVAFGGGPHVCPGTSLTRMELRMVLEKIITRFSGVELVDPDPAAKKSFNFYGPAALPVRFVA